MKKTIRLGNWTYNNIDEKISRELQLFLPDKLFDIHSHIYRVADLNISQQSIFTEGPREVTIDVWREYVEKQVGKSRLQTGLFFGVPFMYVHDINKSNDFLISQLKMNPDSRGLILISPESSQDKITEYLKNPQIVGFKPYHVFSDEKPTFQASIRSFLPEWLWKIAHKHGSIITLHIVKDLALADSDNQIEIRKMCDKYPNVKLILSHAGRGFHAPNTVRGVSALREIENIWFDTSAVCEPDAITAILHEFGPRKLLWGSDFPVSEIRGKCATVGDGFAWLDNNTVNWNKLSPACNPILVGIESLRAIKEAADNFCLNEQDLQDIFFNNALRLLGLKKEPETLTQKLYKHAKQHIH